MLKLLIIFNQYSRCSASNEGLKVWIHGGLLTTVSNFIYLFSITFDHRNCVDSDTEQNYKKIKTNKQKMIKKKKRAEHLPINLTQYPKFYNHKYSCFFFGFFPISIFLRYCTVLYINTYKYYLF